MANEATVNIKTMIQKNYACSFQIGVDVLGFPIYVIHEVKEILIPNSESKFHKNSKKDYKIYQDLLQKIIKQH